MALDQRPSPEPGSLATQTKDSEVGLMSAAPIPVIDLFAGPGGLNEGFSRLGEDSGDPRFATVGSFEMETSAVRTLELRGTYRNLLRGGDVPADYYRFIRGEIDWAQLIANPMITSALESAQKHVHQVELGGPHDKSEEQIAQALISANVGAGSPWVLIGGPPCQAYSLAGRSRRANDETFAADKKHFLYREYLRIITTFAPPVFVMENVKGLLSSTTDGDGMFARIKGDLENPGGGLKYSIHSLVVDAAPHDLNPKDFIIRAEQYGIPQRRHRLILLGVLDGYFEDAQVGRLRISDRVTVEQALSGLPQIRSGISRANGDDSGRWAEVREAMARTYGGTTGVHLPASRGAKSMLAGVSPTGEYGTWIRDERLGHVIQHESRSHMVEDLKRYWFAAHQAALLGISPRLSSFPATLQPLHKNAGSASRPFEDRFRVQVASEPATTVVSHISKDGHYYIHPDPSQMRSLTVREAARLQSFPDNYYFWGNRTQQYHQVGNAVPPLLAYKIAEIVSELFRSQRARS